MDDCWACNLGLKAEPDDMYRDLARSLTRSQPDLPASEEEADVTHYNNVTLCAGRMNIARTSTYGGQAASAVMLIACARMCCCLNVCAKDASFGPRGQESVSMQSNSRTYPTAECNQEI
jgi:hypothetical protein